MTLPDWFDPRFPNLRRGEVHLVEFHYADLPSQTWQSETSRGLQFWLVRVTRLGHYVSSRGPMRRRTARLVWSQMVATVLSDPNVVLDRTLGDETHLVPR